MAYTPDPTNATQPIDSVKARTAAAEFRALKGYIATLSGLTPAVNGLTSINGGQIAGVRNRLINSCFNIWQRGTSFAVAGTTAVYGPDRFFANSNGAQACTLSRQTLSLGLNQYGVRLQRNAGVTGVHPMHFRQIIEGATAMQLRGQTCTLTATVTLGANFSGTALNFRVQSGSAVDEGSASLIAGTWTDLLTPLDSSVAATAVPVRRSLSFELSPSSKEVAVGITYTPVGTAGANDWVQIDDIQLEIGSIKTSQEYLPIGTELALCQRYYETSTHSPIFSGNVTSGETYYHSQAFAVQKRAAPTVTFSYIGASAFAATVPTGSSITATGFNALKAANATGTGFYQYNWTASAEL